MSWTDSVSAVAQGVIHFAAWLSLLMAAGYFVSRAGRSRVIGVLFFLLWILLLHGSLIVSRRILDFPWLLHVHVPVLFLLGPVSLLWISQVLEDPVRLRFYDWLPGAAVFAALLPFYASSSETKRELALAFYAGQLPWSVRWIFVAALVSYAIYLVRSARILLPLMKTASFREDHSVRVAGGLVAYAGIVTLIAFSALFVNRPTALHMMLTGLAFFPIGLYLVTARNPDLFFRLQKAAEKGRYEYSRLAGADLSEVKQRLDDLMNTESLYTEEDITLEDLAGRLGMTPHALSEFFNNHLHTNFPGYINGLRIEHACRLMKNDPDRTVLSIAYESGFSAKSTFNAAFLRHKGCSPTSYRAALRDPDARKRAGRP